MLRYFSELDALEVLGQGYCLSPLEVYRDLQPTRENRSVDPRDFTLSTLLLPLARAGWVPRRPLSLITPLKGRVSLKVESARRAFGDRAQTELGFSVCPKSPKSLVTPSIE